MSDFSIEEVDRKKLARIQTIINHRTEYGSFEDEESDLLQYLLDERNRLKIELQAAKATIKDLADQLINTAGGSQ